MSTSMKDLFDYDLVKKCYRCRNILLKSNLYKNKSKSDGYAGECVSCRKQYFNENQEKTKKYYEKNRDKKENVIMKIKIKLKNIVLITKIK